MHAQHELNLHILTIFEGTVSHEADDIKLRYTGENAKSHICTCIANTYRRSLCMYIYETVGARYACTYMRL